MKTTKKPWLFVAGSLLGCLNACGPGGMMMDNDVVTPGPDTMVRPDARPDSMQVGPDTMEGPDADPGMDAMMPGPEGGPGPEAGPGMDAMPREGGADAQPPVDAGPPVDPCMPTSAIIDLNMMGMTMGNVTRYTGNNNMAAARSTITGTCASTSTGSVVAFKYTPRTTAPLRISTDNAGTAMSFDTVAFARDTCAMTGMDLGCDDDSGTGMGRETTSTFVTAMPQTMGRAIYIFVGGFSSARGNFELSVSELQTVAPGGMCDTSGASNTCAMGSLCVPSAAMSPTGTCVADGGAGGRCRAMGTACDGALTCNGTQTSSFSRCVATVGSGSSCDLSGSTNICAMGSLCVRPDAMAATGMCVADGARGGRCRATGMACDSGLACSGSQTSSFSRCLTSVAVGGMCDTSLSATSACATGSTCVRMGTTGTMGTCVADGGNGGRCRAMGTACDMGLACNEPQTSSFGRCRPAVMAGAMCDDLGVMNACVAGTTCTENAAGTASTCIADGGNGGRCRTTMPACDSNLACNDFTRCVPVVAMGAMCDPDELDNICAMNTFCVTTSSTASTGTCQPAGTAGSRCRPTGMACDSGLACSGPQGSGSSRCRTAVAVGGTCDTSFSSMNACVAGSSCVAGMTGTAGTCVADGAANGRCRTSGMACDANLACNATPDGESARCRTAVMMGGTCDVARITNACIAPLNCIRPMGMTTGTGTCTPPLYNIAPLPSPSFVDACAGGTRIAFNTTSSPRDDAYAMSSVPIPFTFNLFGQAQTALWPSINGHVAFGATAPSSDLGSIPATSSGPIVAPLWQDLVLRDAPSSDVCVKTEGSAPNRRLVVQWLNTFRYGVDGTTLTFELILNETGNTVDFLYQRLDAGTTGDNNAVNGARASIGLQSAMGAQYVLHRETVANNTGLRLTPR